MKLTSRGKLRADVVDHVFQFGHQGDIPVVGDWTGSGVKTIGVFHDGTWFLDTNGDGHFGPEDVMAHFGREGRYPGRRRLGQLGPRFDRRVPQR